jgi:hypothetical protein
LRLRFGAEAMAVGTASPKVAKGSLDEATATSRGRFTIRRYVAFRTTPKQRAESATI